ncbi:MAG TPA: NAD(P)-dependent oxidoreductase [bacterium]|nr:NAD(P)-dependent oxidoreductase [bacterium]
MKPRVFVVQPVPDVALRMLREVAEVTAYPHLDRQISTDELVANAKRCDYLFGMGDTVIPAEVINANPDLKGISLVSRKPGNIDLEAARARKLPVAILHPADAIYAQICKVTGDLTISMLLALAYRLVDADRYTRAGQFKQEQTLALMGVGCPGKTVGLIGLGLVAEFMVPRLHPFEMTVLYTKRTRLPLERERELHVEWAPGKDDVLRRSDYVCIACDYNPSTHLMIGARELALMKPTACLINTARGRIVDEQALVKALRDRTIAGAALDVYWNEPPVTHDPEPNPDLYELPNVILAPHNGGATWDVRGEMTASCARNIVAWIHGERPPGLLQS